MEKQKIEEIAVSAVQTMINSLSCASTTVATKDKEPSWDGHIYVYSNPKLKKNDIVGRIPVQVKGHAVSRISLNSVRRQVEISDLKNYGSDFGVIYFVVEMINSRETKIFYNSMLPSRLSNLLNEKGTQKSIVLEFKELPSNPMVVFKSFLCHRKKQSSENLLDASNKNVETLKWFVHTENVESPVREVLREILHGEYIYGNINGVKGDIPVDLERVRDQLTFKNDSANRLEWITEIEAFSINHHIFCLKKFESMENQIDEKLEKFNQIAFVESLIVIQNTENDNVFVDVEDCMTIKISSNGIKFFFKSPRKKFLRKKMDDIYKIVKDEELAELVICEMSVEKTSRNENAFYITSKQKFKFKD